MLAKDLLTPQLLKRLEAFQLHTKRSFAGQRQGAHRSLRRGHGLEFDDYRLYTPGDDYRYIDWGVYGRTDRLYLRQFREEQDLNVSILIDSSKSMFDKLELSKAIALSLGYVTLSNGDNLRYSYLGSTNTTPTYFGIKSFRRAMADVEKIAPLGSFEWSLAIRKVMDRQKIPGRCFIISDFFYEEQSIISALDYLRSRSFEISLVHIMSSHDLNLNLSGNIIVRDAETNEEVELSLDSASVAEYKKKLRAHFNFLESYCKKAAISYTLINAEETLTEVMFGKFLKQGLLC